MFIQKLNREIKNHMLAWSSLEQQLLADEVGKFDVETDDVCFEADGSMTLDGVKGYQMEDGAQTQIISRFVPKGVSYLRLCQSEPELFSQNMNHWVYENLGKNYLIRTRETPEGKTVRAVLSDRYGIMDNLALFYGIKDKYRDDFAPVDMALSAAQFHLRLAHKEGQDISRYDSGDLVCGGLHFSNSEVGASALAARVITYRLVCTNGMISPETLSQQKKRHLGSSQGMRRFLEHTLEVSGQQMEYLLYMLKQSHMDGFLPNESHSLVRYLGKRQKWSHSLTQAIERELLLESKTKFGLIQAITAVAKRQRPDERLQLEAQAGNLLTQDVRRMAQLALAESQLTA